MDISAIRMPPHLGKSMRSSVFTRRCAHEAENRFVDLLELFASVCIERRDRSLERFETAGERGVGCSVEAIGRYLTLQPRPFFKVAKCNLEAVASSAESASSLGATAGTFDMQSSLPLPKSAAHAPISRD
jgi:hypothetical protein